MSKVKQGIGSSVMVILVVGILIAVNVIGGRFFGRLDLTDSKEFTVSNSTKKILRELDDIVLAQVFFSGKLPDQFATLERNVRDLLKEYEVYSDGNLRIQFIDPGEDEDEKSRAISLGIPQLQANVVEEDQVQILNVFMGIALQYADKVEAIPVISDLTNFEYEMTSKIVKLTLAEQPTLGILQGNAERDLSAEMTGLNQLMGEQYKVRPVDLQGGNIPVPEDVDCLLVAGSKNVPERSKYEIDQFLMRGGKVMFLVDVMMLSDQQGLQAVPANSGLRDMLSFYGVEVDNALALEHPRYAAQARFTQGFLSYLVPYPYWPRSVPGLLSLEHPITSKLESMTLQWTAPLKLTVPGDEIVAKSFEDSGGAPPNLTQNQANVEGVVLARTTEAGWTVSGRYDLNPQSPSLKQVPAEGQSYPLAVSLKGSFASFYAGKTPPAKPGGNSDSGGASLDAADVETPLAASPETQIVIVGSSAFVTDQFLGMFPENSLFVQNSVDWMSLGEELIEIRSRGATDRPLKEISTAAKTAIRWGNTAGVALLLIFFGFLWNGARRKSRRQLAESFGA